VGRIGLDLGLCQDSFGLDYCNFELGHCNFVDVGLELERVVDCIGVGIGIEVVGFGSCMIVVELVQVCGLELGLGNVHLHGILGCSNVHHMSHHRIGLMCHIDLCMLEHLSLVDIVVVELVVVVLVERLANDLR
jgi:hypothetical protein